MSRKSIRSTQELCPVAEVTQEGIIITKSPLRYVRIVEVTPTNFELKSPAEQRAIIGSFTQLLRSAAPDLQLKVLSVRADTADFLKRIRADMEVETNAQCRQLQYEQAELVSYVGAYGVSTRFFLIYQYHNQGGGGYPAYEEIVRTMDDQLASITHFLASCGNQVIVPHLKSKADAQLEYLYTVFSREQAQSIPFTKRKNTEIMRNIANGADSQNLVLAPGNLIAPEVVNNKFAINQILVSSGGKPLYYSFLYLPAGNIPNAVLGGWLNVFISKGAGIDVDIYLHRVPTSRVQQKLRIAQNVNISNYLRASPADPSYYEIQKLVESGDEISAGLANGDMFYQVGVLLTVSHPDRRALKSLVQRIQSYAKGRNMGLMPCMGRQLKAFVSSLPLCHIEKELWDLMKRNALASSIASVYPFMANHITDPNGMFIGKNSNGSLIFLDPYRTDIYSNANMSILGMAGAGKSFLLKCLALRSRLAHNQVFIIAPEKAHEFILPAAAVGGTIIHIGSGYRDNINIMEIRKTDLSAEQSGFGEEEAPSQLIQKINQVHVFFSLLLPDITPEEKAGLDTALVATYKEFGITSDNDSLFDPDDPLSYRTMPILADLYRNLKIDGKKTERIAAALDRFVQPDGSASFFNQQTNVSLENDFIVFDIANIKDESLTPIAMFVVLDYIWAEVSRDISKRKMILIDEIWKLLSRDASPLCAQFVRKIWRLIRSMNGSAVGATQNLNGFFQDENSASDILNNSQINFILKTKPSELTALCSAFGLTETEREQILQFQTGDVLLLTGATRTLMRVEASTTEYQLITTDPNDITARKNL